MYAAAFAGMDLVFYGPKSYEKEINPEILAYCKKL